MTEQQRTLLEEGCAQLESRAGLIWGPEFIEEFAAAIRALLADLAQRTAERDEARRALCMSDAIDRLHDAHPNEPISRCASIRIANEIAVDRGWDCFEEVQHG
jgi:hypothetical protein